MSHITGSVQVPGSPLVIGPGTINFNPPQSPAPGGTKLLMLHFQNLNFKAGDQLQVNLGYATDTFTAADGPAFWTRPINVYLFPAGVPITYIAAGADLSGSVQMDQYGRGERHAGQPGHPSFSNCDPFYTGTYAEPTYDPFWYCADPPNWENAAEVTDPTDVRAKVARSVGMIFSVEAPDLSTCSVTLVDTDKVITAGHCHTPEQALTSSVVFDYQTLAGGSRPPGSPLRRSRRFQPAPTGGTGGGNPPHSVEAHPARVRRAGLRRASPQWRGEEVVPPSPPGFHHGIRFRPGCD
jgi:hypothetical protein